MSGAIKAEVAGLAELVAACASLKRGVRNRVLRKVVGAGTSIVLKNARARAKAVGRPTLARALGRKIRTYSSGTVVGVVGALKGKGTTSMVWSWYLDRHGHVKRYVPRYTDPAKVQHLIEGGTKPHNQAAHVHPGTKALPIMQPTWDQSKGSVSSVMARTAVAGLAAEVAKAAKR